MKGIQKFMETLTYFIPVFCQFRQDRPTLSKRQKVCHHIRPRPILLDVWGDGQNRIHFLSAAPVRIIPRRTSQINILT